MEIEPFLYRIGMPAWGQPAQLPRSSPAWPAMPV